MNRRISIFLLVAVAASLGAGLLTLRFLASSAAPGETMVTGPATSPILIAARDLPAGVPISLSDVQRIEWPVEALPHDAVNDLSTLSGLALVEPLRAREPIRRSHLSDAPGAGLPVLIEDGMRAVSVRVDDVIGVAGFVLPGSRVDVLATIGGNNSTAEDALTRILLQDIKTLTAGQLIQADTAGKPYPVTVVTLQVTPEQAEQLVLASTQGRIQLALRGIGATERTETAGSSVESITRGGAPLRPSLSSSPSSRAATPGSRSSENVNSGRAVEAINGNTRTEMRF